MNYQNDDLKITQINELLPPVALLEKFPALTMRRLQFVMPVKLFIKSLLEKMIAY